MAASGRKWPQRASGRKWPQEAAEGKWPQVAAGGRKGQVAASGRKWPLFPKSISTAFARSLQCLKKVKKEPRFAFFCWLVGCFYEIARDIDETPTEEALVALPICTSRGM